MSATQQIRGRVAPRVQSPRCVSKSISCNALQRHYEQAFHRSHVTMRQARPMTTPHRRWVLSAHSRQSNAHKPTDSGGFSTAKRYSSTAAPPERREPIGMVGISSAKASSAAVMRCAPTAFGTCPISIASTRWSPDSGRPKNSTTSPAYAGLRSRPFRHDASGRVPPTRSENPAAAVSRHQFAQSAGGSRARSEDLHR